MLKIKAVFLLFVFGLVAVAAAPLNDDESDTPITRVQPLPESERGRGGRAAVSEEKPQSVYAVNILTLPRNGNPDDSNKNGVLPDPMRRNPALFFLQKVNDNGALPDGIYYRPAADETETPKPFFEKDLTDVQVVALGQGRG